MDAIILLNRFKKDYPHKALNLEKRLLNWKGNSCGSRLGNINWQGVVKPDPFSLLLLVIIYKCLLMKFGIIQKMRF